MLEGLDVLVAGPRYTMLVRRRPRGAARAHRVGIWLTLRLAEASRVADPPSSALLDDQSLYA